MVLPNGDLQTVIDKIKELREHIPLWSLARDVELSQSHLSQILNGRVIVQEDSYAAQKLKNYIASLSQKHQVKSS